MESSFSQIDNVLNDVDKYLEENDIDRNDSKYSSSKGSPSSFKSNAASPIEQTKNDINDLLRRANIEPTKKSYLTKKYEFPKEEEDSQDFSFDSKNWQSNPGSPSYDFMKNMTRQNKQFSPSATPTESKNRGANEDLTLSPSFSSSESKAYSEQLEAEMFAAENERLYEELMKYKEMLKDVVQKNTNLLKKIEENEVKLYSMKGKL